MANETRELLRRYLDANERKDIDAAMAFWHPDAEGIHPLRPDRSWYGREQLREIWTGTWARYPESHLRVVSSGVDGDHVYLETLMDLGNGTAVPGINVFEVEGGVFRHLRVYTDTPVHDGVGVQQFLDELE